MAIEIVQYDEKLRLKINNEIWEYPNKEELLKDAEKLIIMKTNRVPERD